MASELLSALGALLLSVLVLLGVQDGANQPATGPNARAVEDQTPDLEIPDLRLDPGYPEALRSAFDQLRQSMSEFVQAARSHVEQARSAPVPEPSTPQGAPSDQDDGCVRQEDTGEDWRSTTVQCIQVSSSSSGNSYSSASSTNVTVTTTNTD